MHHEHMILIITFQTVNNGKNVEDIRIMHDEHMILMVTFQTVNNDNNI